MKLSASDFELVRYDAVTADQRAQLEGGETDPFDAGDSPMRYRRKDHLVGLQTPDGALVAQTGMVVVDVEVSGVAFPVVGFGGVIVRAEYRGRGLARQILAAAMTEARTLGPRFVVLFCLPDRAGLYLRLGFSEVEGPVMVEQPDRGYVSMPDPTMWLALDGASIWPAGPVTIRGLPF